jgi:transposase
MKALTISDKESMVMALQDEIRRNEAARYDHRLHGVLLVAQGMTCPQVAAHLGDSPRTVVNWVQRFEARGFAGLLDGERTGRPSRLNSVQLAVVDEALRRSPLDFGLQSSLWDGPTLSAFIKRQYSIELKARQCQRLFRQLGFRLRKPRPQVAKADPVAHAAHKKTTAPGRRSTNRSVGPR